jgi:hypothetical protein
MPSLNLDETSQLLFVPKAAASWLIVNSDEADTCYLAPQKPVHATDVPLPPQASVTLDGSLSWYGSTLAETTLVVALVLPGGTSWTNPVGVEIALQTLGLATAENQETTQSTLTSGIALPVGAATETTLTGVNATLGSPAQDATVASVATNTGDALTAGVPPGVPNINSASTVGGSPEDSPDTVFTFPEDGRLWGVVLSAAVASGSGYTTGAARFYAIAQIGDPVVVASLELNLAGASMSESDVVYVPFNGIPVAAGTPLILNINGGTAVEFVVFNISAVFFYSIP